MDRSYAWNYSHAPTLPKIRRLPSGPGGSIFGYQVNSLLGVAAGPLLNSRWVEGYARLGYDLLTYATVRTRPHAALGLPNIRHVDQREEVAVVGRRPLAGADPTLAVSLGMPSAEPDVWRKDVRRAKERLGPGQILIVSVVGEAAEGSSDPETLVDDYRRCAVWAAEAGADAIEVHLAVPAVPGEPGRMIYEHLPLSAQIVHRIRLAVSVPVIAKFGPFRTQRALHETATLLAPWVAGFSLVHGIRRRIVDEEGRSVFDGADREWADVVGAATFPVAARQAVELLSWRRAGAWPHAILAIGGITTVERVHAVLNEQASAVLVATAALFDPLLASRFRRSLAAAA